MLLVPSFYLASGATFMLAEKLLAEQEVQRLLAERAAAGGGAGGAVAGEAAGWVAPPPPEHCQENQSKRGWRWPF